MLNKREGFTLIELLVVIAIIAILAAILFPVFSKARAKAQQTVCLSNMKQMALSTRMYVSDWDQMFPTVGQWNYFPGTYGWLGALEPYLKNTQILHCPMKSGTGVNYAANGGRKKAWYGYDSLWGFEDWWTPATMSYAASTGEIECPANIISNFEEARGGGSGIQNGDVNAGWYGDFFGQYDWYGNDNPPLHNLGQNFNFADGHAKWYSLVDHPGWNDPQGVPSPNNGTWAERQISFDREYCP